VDLLLATANLQFIFFNLAGLVAHNRYGAAVT